MEGRRHPAGLALRRAQNLFAAGDDAAGIAVVAGLAEGRQIGGDAVVLARPAERHAKADLDLVEDTERAVLVCHVDAALQEALRRTLTADRLHDDTGDLVVVLFEAIFQGIEIAVGHLNRERGDDCRRTFVLRARPVVPAVVAAADDLIAAGVGPRQPHRSRRGRAAADQKAEHLHSRDQIDQHLRDLELLGMRGAVDGALIHLRLHRRVDSGVVVAQQDRTEAQQIVQILVAVHVPEAGAGCPLRKDRISQLQHLVAALVPLAAAHDQLVGAVEQRP